MQNRIRYHILSLFVQTVWNCELKKKKIHARAKLRPKNAYFKLQNSRFQCWTLCSQRRAPQNFNRPGLGSSASIHNAQDWKGFAWSCHRLTAKGYYKNGTHIYIISYNFYAIIKTTFLKLLSEVHHSTVDSTCMYIIISFLSKAEKTGLILIRLDQVRNTAY